MLADITNDGEVKALVDKAKGLVGGVDAETLRSTDAARDRVLAGFSTIKTQLDPMVVTKPIRAISFDEE